MEVVYAEFQVTRQHEIICTSLKSTSWWEISCYFCQYWGLNSGFCAWEAGALLVKPHLQPQKKKPKNQHLLNRWVLWWVKRTLSWHRAFCSQESRKRSEVTGRTLKSLHGQHGSWPAEWEKGKTVESRWQLVGTQERQRWWRSGAEALWLWERWPCISDHLSVSIFLTSGANAHCLEAPGCKLKEGDTGSFLSPLFPQCLEWNHVQQKLHQGAD